MSQGAHIYIRAQSGKLNGRVRMKANTAMENRYLTVVRYRAV